MSNDGVVMAAAVVRASSAIAVGLAIAGAVGAVVSSVAKAVERKRVEEEKKGSGNYAKHKLEASI